MIASPQRPARHSARPALALAVLTLTAGCGNVPHGADSVQLPGGARGIALDDLRFSAALDRIVVPAGRTGNLDLVAPDSLRVEPFAAFTYADEFDGSNQVGAGSADEGNGLVYAVDRAAFTLNVVDPALGIVATVALEETLPDYVRWVAGSSQVWITNPGAERIDVFSVDASSPTPTQLLFIDVPGGPEGLAIDETRRRAYVHLYAGDVGVIDLDLRALVATWPTTCNGAHGIPVVDEERGFLFAGCRAAEIVVLDLDADGAILDQLALDGGGASILGFAPALHHAYLRGDPGTTVAILGVGSDGTLDPLGTFDTTPRGHCLTADDRGNVWVCDEEHGRLFRFADEFDPTD